MKNVFQTILALLQDEGLEGYNIGRRSKNFQKS